MSPGSGSCKWGGTHLQRMLMELHLPRAQRGFRSCFLFWSHPCVEWGCLILGLMLERLFRSLWWLKLVEDWCKALLTIIHTGFWGVLPCLNLSLAAGKMMNFAKSISRQHQVVNLNKFFVQWDTLWLEKCGLYPPSLTYQETAHN